MIIFNYSPVHRVDENKTYAILKGIYSAIFQMKFFQVSYFEIVTEGYNSVFINGLLREESKSQLLINATIG
ncbi:hypothetical protein Xmau_02111 [Xenorhabdus mauleonii]|uniref:Uncharacterized protein n=1 Tax=Xenorhabdus mauleonii TaxID=351675 RepID=A0A1I3QKD9_9GAMM|nr:hypothetical protein Xmau_02111 [Xenorhabdus mauleonii]SFJ34290.1 hypothetical protein SAMN05421680_107196 [Xenorhabdus mauleonii]